MFCTREWPSGTVARCHTIHRFIHSRVLNTKSGLLHSTNSNNKVLSKNYMKMNSMAELLARFQQEGPKEAPPPHELAAAVNLIRDAHLFSEPTYGYTFWLGKVKRAGVSYSDMVGILKNIQGMNSKYNKGGTLNNQLTKLANARKQNEHERQGSTLPKKRAAVPRAKE